MSGKFLPADASDFSEWSAFAIRRQNFGRFASSRCNARNDRQTDRLKFQGWTRLAFEEALTSCSPDACSACWQSCGANGIFSRRLDFSAFNSLPRTKLNSYHIKMEDEGNHGNDDTRCFILSTLAALQWSRVSCVLCRSPMLVFDRYPLVDGTFFLSPRQHSPACAEVKVEGRTQFLSAVCMSCLEGSGGQPVRCRCCTQPWDGSSLVLGTMYSYDIFAAMPCCTERLKCNSCQKPLIYPHQRLNFYSDYSRVFACPHCRAVDAHFVKPLSICFTREQFQLYSQWP
ncbi:hdc homolog, cell cycle regulator isoform X8 [Megachile rotundata]|uniref:hdc homolog, cell cycle regulator isoform X8 n=1 Tax=Megachile rotundata TaxID=143995 RepID=UPI003FD3CF02